jgi:bile acid:Na+ symporter, BASS family
VTAAASLISAFSVPLFVTVALAVFPAGAALHLPVLASALGLFVVSTLPVLAGMWLRQVRPVAARAVEARMGGFALAFIAVVVAAAVLPALLRAGLPAFLTNLLSVSGAWGASGLLGLPRGQRIAVGLECGLQNFALAAFVALTLMRAPVLLLPAIAYGVTMWLSALGLVVLARRSAASQGVAPLTIQNQRNW